MLNQVSAAQSHTTSARSPSRTVDAHSPCALPCNATGDGPCKDSTTPEESQSITTWGRKARILILTKVYLQLDRRARTKRPLRLEHGLPDKAHSAAMKPQNHCTPSHPRSGSKPKFPRRWQLALGAWLASACVGAAAQHPELRSLPPTTATGGSQDGHGNHTTASGEFQVAQAPQVGSTPSVRNEAFENLPPEIKNDPFIQWAVRTGQVTFRNPPRPWPTQLDAEQKALFTESPDLFPYRKLPRTGPLWIDERYSVGSESSGDGWQAYSEADRRVFIYDVETGTKRETPLRGFLECYTATKVVLATGWRYYTEGGKEARVRTTLEGPPDGSAMVAREYPSVPRGINQYINVETCQPYDRKRFFPEGTHGRVLPLKAGHGYLVERFKKNPAPKEMQPLYFVMNEEGEELARIPMLSAAFHRLHVQYSSANNRYFIPSHSECGDTGKASAKPSLMASFEPLGKNIQMHSVPPLIANFMDWNLSCDWTMNSTWTAKGVVYNHDANDDPLDPMVGLYIEHQGRLHRFLNKPVRVLSVSPSGCQLAVNFFDRSTPVRSAERKASDYASRLYQLCTEK
jgi:hypothetical protein